MPRPHPRQHNPPPTPATPATPVEPYSPVNPRYAEQWIEAEKANLANGKITPEEATRRFDALGATPEQRAPDTRSEYVRQLDRAFPPARPEEFLIQWHPPGQQPTTLSKEDQALDTNARKWMAAMGLSREQGNGMAAIIAKTRQQRHPLSVNERENFKDRENMRMDRVHGPNWQDDQLPPVARMIHEVNALHPGLKAFVAEEGDNADLLMELIKAAHIYDARKGR